MARSTVVGCAWVVICALGITRAGSPSSPTPAAEPTAARGSASAPTPARGLAPTPAPTAAELVKSALDAGLAGDASGRHELLAQAVAADPDYAPARWLRGEVRFEGRWQDLIEVGEVVLGDRRWQQYRELKKSTPNTADGHLQLARWCFREGLENEERYHWAQVLSADPEHELARTRLGLDYYRGALRTKDEIAKEEARRSQAVADLARYTPEFDALCRQVIEATSPAESTSALAALKQVDDVGALAALELAVQRASRDAAEDAALELNLAFIAAASNIPDHEATLKLLNYSVLSPMPEVRQLAARSLRPRPVTDYVPQLMASLNAPIKASIESYTRSDGAVAYRERLFQAGPEADRLVKRDRDLMPSSARSGAEVDRAATAANIRDAGAAAAVAGRGVRQRVALTNQQSAARNERIRVVLRDALSLDLGADPTQYWEEWQSYNELYYEEHPVSVEYDYDVSFYDPIVYVPPPMPPVSSYSCFKAGTPVWTQAGLTPIERIEVGDIVLAQNPATGELAFRPVTQKTLGPPIDTVDIAIPGETITATRGHRFWVNGRGWEMAKALREAMPLHTLDAPLAIETVTPGERLRCHNLVVDGFHTFFVGESRLLVHDKTCPQPTSVLIPGH